MFYLSVSRKKSERSSFLMQIFSWGFVLLLLFLSVRLFAVVCGCAFSFFFRLCYWCNGFFLCFFFFFLLLLLLFIVTVLISRFQFKLSLFFHFFFFIFFFLIVIIVFLILSCLFSSSSFPLLAFFPLFFLSGFVFFCSSLASYCSKSLLRFVPLHYIAARGGGRKSRKPCRNRWDQKEGEEEEEGESSFPSVCLSTFGLTLHNVEERSLHHLLSSLRDIHLCSLPFSSSLSLPFLLPSFFLLHSGFTVHSVEERSLLRHLLTSFHDLHFCCFLFSFPFPSFHSVAQV